MEEEGVEVGGRSGGGGSECKKKKRSSWLEEEEGEWVEEEGWHLYASVLSVSDILVLSSGRVDEGLLDDGALVKSALLGQGEIVGMIVGRLFAKE